jgi:crooked neck
MPKRVKRRRKAVDNNNEVSDNDAGWEEYFDYIFPEDENARPNLKLLAMAKMWKKQKEVGPTEDEIKEEPEETSDANETSENLDADDADIKNESSSDEEDDDEDKGEKDADSSASPPPEKRRKNDDESD